MMFLSRVLFAATLSNLWSPAGAEGAYQEEMAVATYAVQVASTVARELQGELCQKGAIRCPARSNWCTGKIGRFPPSFSSTVELIEITEGIGEVGGVRTGTLFYERIEERRSFGCKGTP